MNVIIMWDSKFGNTQKLAQTMKAALADSHSVQLRPADQGLRDAHGVDVLLVGGPTHGHGASQPLKSALTGLPEGTLLGTRVATFDTRFRLPKLMTGSAASTATKLLKRAGASPMAPSESFFVSRDNPPQLEPGELERAASWARAIMQ
jgi:flavodoxin